MWNLVARMVQWSAESDWKRDRVASDKHIMG
jgi:hypothetical protein